ncbi:RdRP-domain-containing protein [Hypoxylon trugodes]|uniref:RdRP-domain-containing protein n=1 Tax=Hypoxylon trugodes TaxID=326681 RepID=UPI00218F1D04|nr:RdRP-domain-containing protein [Hypoxylon trugodes]KAI1392565.1 RdRP-domain-containing protein [Hypoxylon trugodes]
MNHSSHPAQGGSPPVELPISEFPSVSIRNAEESKASTTKDTDQSSSISDSMHTLPPQKQPRFVLPYRRESTNQKSSQNSETQYDLASSGASQTVPQRPKSIPGQLSHPISARTYSAAGSRRNPTSMNGKSGQGPHLSALDTSFKPQWTDWDSISLRIRGLPPQATPLEIRTIFKVYGELDYVELFKGRRGERDGAARICYTPPPSKQFWNDTMNLTVSNQNVRVRIELMEDRRNRQIRASNGRVYPSLMRITMEALQFGMLTRENEMMPLQTVRNDKRGQFFLATNLQSKKLEILFACNIKDPRRENPSMRHPEPIGKFEYTQEYKTHIPFIHLKNLVEIDVDEDTWALIIPLPSPPLFYIKHDSTNSHSENKNSWSMRDVWNRTVDITYDTAWFKDDPVSLRGVNQFIDIGRWTTYRLTFAKSALPNWKMMREALQSFNIGIDRTTSKEFSIVPARALNFWDQLEPRRSNDTKSGSNLALLADTEDIRLPYDVRYQLETCISQGFFNEANITTEFLQRLADLSKSHTKRRNRARDLLSYVSQPRIGNRPEDSARLDGKRIYDPMSLFEDKKAMRHYPEISLPEHCQWVRKVVVTPTTMYLSNPAPEPSNRVLRHYANHEDHFIRVQFTDEITKGRIFPAPDNTKDNALFNRVHRTLRNGIRIGGRHFQYLATGNSQFRENGAYFFCPTDFLTCDNIRAWMGDVNHIRNVAKYAARLGQCFSTTSIPKTSPIGQTIVHIQDIERNGRCFTDGVGKIAPSRARFLVQNLSANKSKAIPSVFQFRLGGSKGILVQWPDVPFNEVHLRPSQNKFNSTSKGLEIIKSSRFSIATLNRQTINILSCLGVPDKVFEDMMKKQVADYELAMEDPRTAMQLLSKYVDQNGITTTMAQMIADGFMLTQEPFFVTVLQVWRAWSMRLLREKARIVVDQGAFVFGCADETRTLRGHFDNVKSSDKQDPNTLPQIFLQVPRVGANPGEQGEYTVITGICMLGRNPSLHPGDIRVVQAVDVPALRHIRDVVVFPTTGDRDIPSMCSGGDLDGDDYFVVWDPQLIPHEWNHPPMEHDALKPKEEQLDRDVRVSDLISFFVRYMKNDALSTIAHAHVAKSDMLEDGPKDPQCIELARLHSNAVDYPKTGREALLDASLRPRRFPHFMEKPAHKTYRSQRILGRLYDQVAKVDFRPKLDGTFDERILRRYVMNEEKLKTVRMVKRQHDKAMKQIMNQHDVRTEFEVWSTFVLSKPLVGSDYKRQESMEPVMVNHRERFREACVKLAGSREMSVLYPIIAATYFVTWEEVQAIQKKTSGSEALATDEMPLISFPWIFGPELGRIATSKEEFALENVPEPTMALLDDDNSNDEDEFERLVGAGVIEDENKMDDNPMFLVNVANMIKGAQQQTAQKTSETHGEELVELNDDGETSMDELAKLLVEAD